MEIQKYSIQSLLNPNNKFKIMYIVLKNLKNFFLFFFFLNFNNFSHAHIRGAYYSEQEAENRSFELGCEGIHKNNDKWLPCKNEKELHIYLRK